MIKIPAAGFSKDSSIWEDNYEEYYVRISQICISYKDTAICSLQFYYVDPQGNYLHSPLRGIDNVKDSIYRVISLDFEKEFLTGLSGDYGCCDINSTNSLTFITNIKNYGPFGGRVPPDEVGGSAFDLQLGNVEVFNGFHGSSNQFGITSIGLFVKPRPVPQPEPVVKTETTGLEIIRYENQKMIKAPAVGFKSGSVWEEKGYTKASQIFISYKPSKVCAVQFQLVDRDGSLVLSPLHGSDDDATLFSAIHLDVQTEFVTGLSGYGGKSLEDSLLSLTITTNIRNYGPFGERNPNSNNRAFGKPSFGNPNVNPDHETFDVQLGDKEAFGGFHGTSSANIGLTSVGLFVKPRARLP